MQDLGSFVDFPSPPNSLYYGYGELEQCSSESHSPNAYDATSAGDSSISSRYPSPGHEDGDESAEQQKPAAKRKRENRYKNAPPAVLSRRRAQNRASQRAYRERKDQRIKDLEQLLTDAQQRNDVLSQAYAALHAEYVSLKASQDVTGGGADPSGGTSYPQHHHQHHHQYDLAYASGAAAVAAAAAASAAGVGMGTAAGAGAGGVDGLGMDLFVYNDMHGNVAGYSL